MRCEECGAESAKPFGLLARCPECIRKLVSRMPVDTTPEPEPVPEAPTQVVRSDDGVWREPKPFGYDPGEFDPTQIYQP